MRKFFFVLLFSIISATTVSIGSCLKYSLDGQSCQLCIPNYHSYDGLCYVDILGCSQYQFGNICHQCQKNYILVNNMCCDMVCMSKIFSKFKKQIKEEVIQNNTEILSQIIPYAQKQYIQNSTGRLVAIQVNQYEQAKRFFLLYQFYETQFYSKRLIVDYIIKSKKIIIVDWTQVKNTWNYGNVQWVEVQDDASILLLYPNLYPSGHSYSQIVVRKAVLSEINQFQIATRDGSQMLLLILYNKDGNQVILKTVNQLIASTTQIISNPNNTSNNTVKPEELANSTSQNNGILFSPYQLQYKGQDINAQLDVNQPLITSLDLIKNDQGWKSQNYALTLIIQAAKIPSVIEFTIFGQNKSTGSVIKYQTTYNKPTSQAFIVSVTTQNIQVQVKNVTLQSNTENLTTSGTNTQTVDMIHNNVYVVQQGSTTHTIYEAPLSPEMQTLVDNLKNFNKYPISNSTNSTNTSSGSTEETPFISYVPAGLTFRRLVVSQFCQGSPYREVAYVEANTTSKLQYFTYFFQVNDPSNTTNKTWYPLGDQNKNQTQYWDSVSTRPLYQTDPSFTLSPAANFSQESGILSDYRSNLTSQDQEIFDTLQAVPSTQIDRAMGSMKRFAVNFADPLNDYRVVGFKVLSTIPGINGNGVIGIFCPVSQVTQTLFISSFGPSSNSTTSSTPSSNNTTTTSTITTTVSTNVLGDQTVKTLDVQTFLNQDQILQQILDQLRIQKPIISNYKLNKIQITQFNQALEYHLAFVEANVNNESQFIPESQINAVVVHQIQTNINTVLSFQVKQLTAPSIENSSQTQVHASVTPTSEQYVLIDTKTNTDYNSPLNSSLNANTTIQTSSQNSTTENSGPIGSPITQNATNNTQTIPLTDQIKQIQAKQRTQQIIQSILQQLQVSYNLTDPAIVQALQKLQTQQNIIKINLIVLDSAKPLNYSVQAIAILNSQNDPIIQSVKPITPQIVQILTPIPPTQTSQVCQNKTINSDGVQVCADLATSGEPDINPLTDQNAEHVNSINSTTIAQPSLQVLQLIEEKSYQQTSTIQGQVIKIYLNPQTTGLGLEIQQIVNLATRNEQLNQAQNKNGQLIKDVKVVGIQVAATNLYTHYAITIKTVYTTIITIRRYYFIRGTSIIDMGVENLISPYDLKLPQNRAFKSLLTYQLNNSLNQTYVNVLNIINNQTKVLYIITNIISIRYRLFPAGTYQRVTLKNNQTVANAHLVIKNESEITLLNWHSQTISQLINETLTNNTLQIQHQNSTSANSSFGVVDPNSGSISQVSQNSTQPSSNQTNNSTTQVKIQIKPEEILTQQQQIPSDQVVLSEPLQLTLKQVLQFLSRNKSQQLTGSSLQQYAMTQQKSIDGTLSSIKADLYFVKLLNDTLIRQYICSLVKYTTGPIEILIFLSNDIDLLSQAESAPFIQQSGPVSNLSSISPNTTISNNSFTIVPITANITAPEVTIQQVIVDQQVKLNSDFIQVDPNGINYPQAISLIDQDPIRKDFDQNIDLSNLPSSIEQIIRFVRAKYQIVKSSGVLRIVLSTKTTTVYRYVLYFYKQLLNGKYQIYRAIIDYSTQTPQKRFNVISFDLYAQNNQLVIQPTKVTDQSFKDDTDIAYGYVNLDLSSITDNSNIQIVLRHINNKYREILINKKVANIQQLRLIDGRVNYKIVFRDSVDQSQLKFVTFYQPLLKKVLVLNSVNLPHHSQYNQLSSDQQKSDSLFNSVLSYINSLHPTLTGFIVRSATKAVENAYTQFQITIQKSNKKYKSLVRVASNNIDLAQISFSEMVQVSLDHYRLDQFDQMFIMNYQKLTQTQIRQNSQVRMALAFLNNNQKITDSEFMGAASKPYGLGFIYKLFLKIGSQKQLAVAEVYIQSYSEKISLKSYKLTDFDADLLAINVQQAMITKLISLIKQKTTYNQVTVKSVSAKDFLYGTLYKVKMPNANGSVDIYIYHDHSTQQITVLFSRIIPDLDQCRYEGTTCMSCLDPSFRIQKNRCVQKIENCQIYSGQTCSICNSASQLCSGLCILKNECGALCQVIQL